MASIQCSGCKAHITVPGLINCPRCQTFLDPPFLRERAAADAKAAVRAAAARQLLGPKEWLGLAVLAAVIVGMLSIGYRVLQPSESQVHDRNVMSALLACQQRITGMAEYGEAETPPYSKNFGKGDEFYFAWQRGSFHFKNGFGASVPMSASCIGSVSTGEIQQLTVNGKIIT
jgi:hypothetical protein